MGLPDLHTLAPPAKSAVVLVLNHACCGAEIRQDGSQGLGAQGMEVNTMDDLNGVQQWVADGARRAAKRYPSGARRSTC